MKENQVIANLVSRCRKNDRRAQALLYEQIFPAIMKVSRRYRSQNNDARSLANLCYLKVLLQLDKYDDSLPFLPWMTTVSIRTCIDELRKSKNYTSQIVLSDEDYVLEGDADGAVWNQIHDEISAEQVDSIMNQLPERQKLIFNLFEFEGYKHEEISEMLEISVRTSKRLLHDARALLREQLIRTYKLKDVI